ncbi:hypothetical protein FNV43_RR22817 [Rhamnella rubrinervis]|uniref:Uncharacterized protein n=1 Tax=Rhamnella rubrinervis TaxID=2594499 RepID=A0A8K0DR53_9ROSA|nr:hypothetical protein FNV43_RR22817 [Rhamnella rubrinervis]
MSDRVVQSYHDSDGMSRQAMRPYQCSWMAHWMRSSCKSAKQGCSHLSICYESEEVNHDARQHHFLSEPETVANISKHAKGFSEGAEAKTVNVIGESMIASSEKLRSDRLDCQSFPVSCFPEKTESIVAEKNAQAISHLRSHIDLESRCFPFSLGRNPDAETSSREYGLQPECISQHPEQPAKFDKFIGSSSTSVTKSLQDDFMRSASKIMPHGCNSSTPVQSTCYKLNSIIASKDQATTTNYPTNSMFLVHEKTINMPGGSKSSLSRQNNMALFPQDTSKSIQQHDFVGKQCQKMQDCTGIGFLPSQSIPQGLHSSKNLYLDCSSLRSFPCSKHNMENMRICSTMDSMEDPARGPTKFSQTTHHFMFGKKNSFDFSKGGQMLKESSISTKLKGKTFPELFSLCSDYGLPAQPGVKLQLLGGSSSSEGDKDVKRPAVNLNNESSADTDTMDMDSFWENHASGMASSPTNKCIELDEQSPTSQSVFALSGEEIGDKLMKANLPDINQELPSIAAFATSVDDRDTSTSRTQSFDVEHLLSHAEQSKILKSSASTDVFVKPDPSRRWVKPDPSSRWVKRLKLSPTSARGTKSSEMAEASSREKVHKFFSQSMKCSVTSSELTMGRCQGKEHAAFDQTALLLRNSESSSIDSKKESQDLKLSHPWIRRWCRNVVMSPPKKSKAVEFCEPQCSKAILKKVQKKHYPSLAAMALMGKAVSGFSPCEFSKRGSFVVWNSK